MNLIDINYHQAGTAKRPNLCHRSIGIGFQGPEYTFILLGMTSDSLEVKLILAWEILHLGPVDSNNYQL